MKIFGIIDLSTLDYPKRCSSVVFMSGCNMRCGYCHNYLQMKRNTYNIPPCQVYKRIDLTFSEAIVVSGGEPTLQPQALTEFCRIVKREENLPIKLDTNGSNVDTVKRLIEEDLIDYLAVDVKCAFDKYWDIAQYHGSKIEANVKKLIKICKRENVFIECRTTYIPEKMDKRDIYTIVKTVKGCNLYALQQFDSEHSWKEEYRKMREPTLEELVELGRLAREYIPNVAVRSKEGIVYL
ncbi:MAG TPA: anaerobic ribonucleoside-triphosphate reductase activating protein [Methanothermococcus okinawensis]|uniref:Anaerobic ribonucleoside-triphosphate reductase activating protein n=1 Tax=Methanothermococcus okinawensis TaxID=155863 RepID=A0A832ZCC4_9EURY|nr:anaerobic ribonucleoside-triphosphate reductase activating protein [Methanothermococcus okinawensis]HIP90977.1 anaerobic ribonucleoside-triphosphate reductase activating protein [Methanothermococcus okinawensis]